MWTTIDHGRERVQHGSVRGCLRQPPTVPRSAGKQFPVIAPPGTLWPQRFAARGFFGRSSPTTMDKYVMRPMTTPKTAMRTITTPNSSMTSFTGPRLPPWPPLNVCAAQQLMVSGPSQMLVRIQRRGDRRPALDEPSRTGGTWASGLGRGFEKSNGRHKAQSSREGPLQGAMACRGRLLQQTE